MLCYKILNLKSCFILTGTFSELESDTENEITIRERARDRLYSMRGSVAIFPQYESKTK